MGIGEWLGFGREEPEPARMAVPRVPTAADLLASVERVEVMAVEGKVRPEVIARLRRVTRIVRETIPRLDRLGGGSAQAYHVMATATDYLPEAIGGYLRLPRHWADSRPVDRGKTPLMILVDQLDLLGRTMDKVFDAINRADAEALVIHGRFLQEKFGHASTGGALQIGGATPLSPMPPTASPAAPTASPAAPAARPAAPAAPDIRLQPPTGRQT
ncbi:MAG: hypothetical protein WAR57_10810 [Candidatus Phosphoribacter sp.]